MQILKVKPEWSANVSFDIWMQQKKTSYACDAGSETLSVLREAFEAGAASERERICAAIKAEDDHCAEGDYMLDSDDCVRVARGTWVRPDWTCGETQA